MTLHLHIAAITASAVLVSACSHRQPLADAIQKLLSNKVSQHEVLDQTGINLAGFIPPISGTAALGLDTKDLSVAPLAKEDFPEIIFGSSEVYPDTYRMTHEILRSCVVEYDHAKKLIVKSPVSLSDFAQIVGTDSTLNRWTTVAPTKWDLSTYNHDPDRGKMYLVKLRLALIPGSPIIHDNCGPQRIQIIDATHGGQSIPQRRLNTFIEVGMKRAIMKRDHNENYEIPFPALPTELTDMSSMNYVPKI